MKLLIFSDSHGNVELMEKAVRMEHPDQILHLGDLVRDAQELQSRFPQIPVTIVAGNCDGRRTDLPEQRVITLGDCKILMMHGHNYHVKAGIGEAVRAAREAGAHILLFGHTHVPQCEFRSGIWIVNPGSAGKAEATYAVSVLEDGDAVCYISTIG